MTTTIVWAALAVVFVNTLLVVRGRRSQQRFTARTGLDPATAPQQRVLAQLALRNRSVQVGGTAGALVAVGVALLVARGALLDLGPLLVLSLTALGVAAGLLLGSLRVATPPSGGAPRTARSDVPVLPDYVPSRDLWVVRVAAVMGLLAGLIVVGIAAAGVLDVGVGDPAVLVALGAALTSVAALLGFEAVARRVVQTPQPAGSAPELAWDDALRSANLRSAAWGPAMAAVASAGTALAVLAAAAERSGSTWWIGGLGAAFGGLVLVMFGLLLVHAVGRPETHVLRRLWPELAAAGGVGPGPGDVTGTRPADVGGASAAGTGQPAAPGASRLGVTGGSRPRTPGASPPDAPGEDVRRGSR